MHEDLRRLVDEAAVWRDFKADVKRDPQWWMVPGGRASGFWLRRLHQLGTWAGWPVPFHRPSLRRSGGDHALVVIRVDDFPRWDLPLEVFLRFDALMVRYQVPYALGVTPFLAVPPRAGMPLTEDEVHALHRIAERGISLAHHGFTHAGRAWRGRVMAELLWYSESELEELVARADHLFEQHHLPRARIMIPPFDALSADTLHWLSRRYAIVTGGPASLTTLGPVAAGVRVNGTTYLPSYYPDMYPTSSYLRLGERLWRSRTGPVTVLTLHWAWEARDGFHRLERLLRSLQGGVSPWDAVLACLQLDRPV